MLHFNITRQMTTTALGIQTVWRTAKKSCGEYSPEVPGVPLQAITTDLYTVSAMKCEITEMPGKINFKNDFNE